MSFLVRFGREINCAIPHYDCQSVDYATFLPRDAMHKRGVCRAVSVCPSVLVSVMFVYSIFTFFSPSGNHAVLVFPYLTGVWKKMRFATNMSIVSSC